MRRRALLPMEARVAELAAAGRSSREAAVELGVSQKALEWHLSRAYRKLGAHSPTELAAALAERRG